MRFLFCCLLVMLPLAASAEQFIESQGQKLVAFDVPGVEITGTRGTKVVRTTFAQKFDNGKLQITTKTKRWLKVDNGALAWRDERNTKRTVQTTRLRTPVEIPGAEKVLMYTSTAPYNSLVIVLFTGDFRCELMVTGTKDAKKKMGPTYDLLLKTLRVLPKHER